MDIPPASPNPGFVDPDGPVELAAFVRQQIRHSRRAFDLLERLLALLREHVDHPIWRSDAERRAVNRLSREILGEVRRDRTATSWSVRQHIFSRHLLNDSERQPVTLLTVRGLALAVDGLYRGRLHEQAIHWYHEHDSGLIAEGQYRLAPGDPVPRSLAERNLNQSAASRRPQAFRPDSTPGLVLAGPEVRMTDTILDFRLERHAAFTDEATLSRIAVIQPKLWSEANDVPTAPDYPERIYELLAEVGTAKYEVAVLPEGVLTGEHVSQRLAETIRQQADAQRLPPVVVAGSAYVGDADHLRNNAEIWSTAGQTERFEAATKNTPANREPIGWSKKPHLRLFIAGSVKLAVIICADLNDPYLQLVLHTLGVERVFVPASTRFVETFAGDAVSITVSTDGRVALANVRRREPSALFAGPADRCDISPATGQEDFYGWVGNDQFEPEPDETPTS